MVRLFRHYVPGSFLLLFIIESCVLFAALGLGIEVSAYFGLGAGQQFDFEWLLPRSILFTAINIGCMTFAGLYWRHRKESEWLDYGVRIIGSLALGMTLLALSFYSYPQISVDRSSIFFAIWISLVLITLIRLLHYAISDHEASRRRILVIGTGSKAQMIEQQKRRSDLYGVKIVGFLHIPGEISKVSKERIISSISSLKSYVEENTIDEIVVAVDDRRKSFPVDEILECKMDGLIIYEAGDFIERQVKKIRLDTLHPSSMIFSDGYSRAVMNTFGKRVFDVVASVVMMILSLPVMILTALSIWLEAGCKGSIIYKQERVGQYGRPFNLFKFRSMREDAEKEGVAQWAKVDDERITKNGKIIRLFRIDELPQLFNVLKGQMSFVGPRPERPQFVEELSQIIPFYNIRHNVKPGITGWAQISYPYGASEQDAIEKLQYDLYYIKRYSLLFDILILFQTAQAIIWSRGAR